MFSEAAVHVEASEPAGGSGKEDCETQSCQQSPFGGSSEDILLEDDDLGKRIELSLFLREIDAISQKVDSYWRDAARHQLSIPLAAWLTTTALHAVGRMFGRLQHVVGTCADLIAMWLKYKQKSPPIRFKDIPGLASQTDGRCADKFALWRAARILQDCRTLDEYRAISSNAGAPSRPFESFRGPTISVPSDALGADRIEDLNHDLALDEMQQSMRQLLVSGRAVAAFEASGEDAHISEHSSRY